MQCRPPVELNEGEYPEDWLRKEAGPVPIVEEPMIVGASLDGVALVVFEVVAIEIILDGFVDADGPAGVTEGIPGEGDVPAVPDFDAFVAVFVEVAFKDARAVGEPDILADFAVADGVILNGDVIFVDAHAVSAVVYDIVSDCVPPIDFGGNAAFGAVLNGVLSYNIAIVHGFLIPSESYSVLIFARVPDNDIVFDDIFSNFNPMIPYCSQSLKELLVTTFSVAPNIKRTPYRYVYMECPVLVK